MFGSYKVKIEGDLLDKVKQCVDAGGYGSVDEFVTHVLEKEIKKVFPPEGGCCVQRTREKAAAGARLHRLVTVRHSHQPAMFSPVPTYGVFAALPSFLQDNLPLVLVILVSAIIGLLMVLVFGYTSDQKAIHTVKDQLKAHLLAVRLYQDQLPVVLASYGRILSGTGRYLKLAFKPLLYVILPSGSSDCAVGPVFGFCPAGHGAAVPAQSADDRSRFAR